MGGWDAVGAVAVTSVLVWAGEFAAHEMGLHTFDSVVLGVGATVILAFVGYQARQYVADDTPDSRV